ncbi:hypothetical protein BCR44DRAFT_1455572 [Catenaria anguillulae PL171]|uniref:RNI-like protein n=1 Tax=Catenaria anguillulae PL171 TaxID=765915 RepID=A0A1Y2H3A2_9FUNG|nr:hypothetical protein BCR44DRAFT_1455572 [Catenaria anguillulae PL171]
MQNTAMSLQVIDYLEAYNLQCARRNAFPIPFLQALLTKCIDDGQIPSEFHLLGNHAELREHRLTDDYLDILIIPFAGKDFLTTLDLSYNQITDKGGAILAKWLRTTQTLRELILASNSLGPGAGSVLSESLTVNTTLTTLDLSHNNLGNDGGMAVAGMLQVNTTLTRLRLARCDLSLPALIALCTVLHHNRTLRSLDISDNSGGVQHRAPSLHSDFVRHLSHMLAANKSLADLSLAKLGIDDYDMAQHLGPALAAATSLESLDLSSNRIMQDGATVLAATLVSHPSLQTVRLSHNTLTSLGLGSLVRMLKDNTVLASLYLDHVGAGSDALLALAHVLLGLNKTIKRLAIWGNEFHDATPTGMSFPEAAVAGSGTGNGCTCDVWDKLVSKHHRLEPEQLDVCFYVVEGEWDVAKNERFVG